MLLFIQNKINDIGKVYGKEISELRNKLNDANSQIEKFKEYKNTMQENLKKSLLRGVTAMNLEAMTILEPEQSNLLLGHSNIIDNVFASQISEIEHKNPTLQGHTTNINQSINQSGQFHNNYDILSDRDYKQHTNSPPNKSGRVINHNSNNQYDNNSYISEVIEKKVKSLILYHYLQVTTKDSNWINASSVPVDMRNRIISKEEPNNYNTNTNNTNQYNQQYSNNSNNYSSNPIPNSQNINQRLSCNITI